MSCSTSSRLWRQCFRAPGTLSVPLGSEPGGSTHGVDGITRSKTAETKSRFSIPQCVRTVSGARTPPIVDGAARSAFTQVSTWGGVTSVIFMRPRSVSLTWRRTKSSSLNLLAWARPLIHRSPNSATVGTGAAAAGSCGAWGLGASGSHKPSSYRRIASSL